MTDEDLSDLIAAANAELKQNWVSPTCFVLSSKVLLLTQHAKDPRVWSLHVFENDELIHSVDFEPSP